MLNRKTLLQIPSNTFFGAYLMPSLSQPSGHDGPGGPGADDDEVELVVVVDAARQDVGQQLADGVAEVELEHDGQGEQAQEHGSQCWIHLYASSTFKGSNFEISKTGQNRFHQLDYNLELTGLDRLVDLIR